MNETSKTAGPAGSRRGLLHLAACLSGAALCVAAMPQAQAAALSKASVGYRDIPSDKGKVCANCALFILPAQGAAHARCKLVAGPISPAGWCQIWTPRS
ncbi:MAG TPA: high-potential iron-sulfur protein [Acetobacteraceae bacterium]|nr:high-potential iron-sulfur protein [Acetobacteraceae bacterium]